MRENLPRPEQITELAALSSLEMLTVREQQSFDRLLEEGRPEWTEELKSFEAVVSTIGLSVPEQSPSPRLREQLLARVTKTSSLQLNTSRSKQAQTGTRNTRK